MVVAPHPMLTLLLLTPRLLLSCLRLLSFHHHLLHMFHLSMALMTLVHECLVNMLVIPAKDLVGTVEEMMMRMMISSRSSRRTPHRPFLVMDDKGGENVKIKASICRFSGSGQANPEVSGFQIWKFRIWVWCHMPCNKFILALLDLRTICNV